MIDQGKFSTRCPSRIRDRPLSPDSHRLPLSSPAMQNTCSLGTPGTLTNLPSLKYESLCPENEDQRRPRLSMKRELTKSSGSPLGLRKIVLCPFFHLVKPS